MEELGDDIEIFSPLPKPPVTMYGAAANAGSRPLANLVYLIGSQNFYLAEIELPQVQSSDYEVDWVVNSDNEVTVEGQIPRGETFANMPLGNKSKRIKLCPTESWAISFCFPSTVNWWTAMVVFTSKTVMEISVMKAPTVALPPTLFELPPEAETPPAEDDEAVDEAVPSEFSSPSLAEMLEEVDGWFA